MAARAGGYLRAPPPSPAPCTPPSPPARPPRPGRALTPGLDWRQTRRRATRGRRAQRGSPGRGGGRRSRGRLGAPRPSLALLAPWREWQKEARCWRTGSRSPARHPARRPGGREDPGAAGWRGAGPRPLSRRRGPQCLHPPRHHPQRDAAGGSCWHRLLCRAREQLPVRRSRLGASGLPRLRAAPAGEARPLTCSSASPGVPSPHERCLQILKASFEMLERRVPSPLHTHSTSESKGLDRKLSLSHCLLPVLLLQGTIWWKTWPQTPALNFFPTCRRSLLEAISPDRSYWRSPFPNRTNFSNTSTWMDLSKRKKKSVFAPTLSKAILLNGTSSRILGTLLPFEEFLPLLPNPPSPPPQQAE